MMNREKVAHILRAIAGVTGETKLALVGSATVLLRAKNIPAAMLNTNEIDVFSPNATDEEMFVDLVSGSLGRGSQFDQTFNYFGDGVTSRTAKMPSDWRERATIVEVPTLHGIEVLVPDLNDVALAKMLAWREKDRNWLQAGVRSKILDPTVMRGRLSLLPETEAPREEVQRRMDAVAAYASK